ncbi:MAG: hypothetical protein RI907_1841 [Pseudomonadota bacterium]|jgi:general L-amino acid transport system permease protein
MTPKSHPPLAQRLLQGLGWLLLGALAWHLGRWGLWLAEFSPDPQACQALQHTGACWGVVPAKWGNLLFGHYPQEAWWRPAVWVLLCVALYLAAWWRCPPRLLCGAGVVAMAAGVWLMGGGLGLPSVPSTAWGGLPLTLIIALGSYLLSWPVALALALARRSSWRQLSWPATVCIEAARGVPLVTLLFMAAFLLPLALPEPDSLNLLQRAMAAMTLFSAVYLAEVLRSGLQTVPAEQSEAASILGLGWWGTQQRVVLPQAMRAVLPALTGHAIGLFKDGSLVMVVGLHELTGGLSLSLGGDPLWRPFYFEAYLAVGAVYALCCFGLSALGRRLEQHWVMPQS